MPARGACGAATATSSAGGVPAVRVDLNPSYGAPSGSISARAPASARDKGAAAAEVPRVEVSRVEMARSERPGSSRQEQEANDVFARLIDKQNYGGVARVAHGGLVTPRDGRPAAAEGGTGVTARDEAQGEQHATGGFACTSVITGHAGHVHCMLAAKGQLFSASQDQTVRVWGLQREGFRHMAELSGHHGFVRTLAVSGGGALLFSGSQDKNIRVWDTHTHVQLCALPGHQEEVRALAVHNDLLFSGSEDSTIKVWNIASLKCIRTLGGHTREEQKASGGHTAAVFVLSVCGEPPVLASGSRDHTVRLWDLTSLECKGPLGSPKAPGHLDGVTSFAAVGGQLYSGSRDCSIKHWSLTSAELLKTAHRAHDDWVCSLAASETARLLVSGGGKTGRIKLWGLGSLEYAGVLDGHSNSINRLVFNDGAIFSASSDRTIRVWTTSS